LWLNTVGKTERAIVASRRQFCAVCLKFKLSVYIQETIGDRRGCIQRALNKKKQLVAAMELGDLC